MIFLVFNMAMGWAVVVHAFNSSTWKAEAGTFLSQGQPCLQSEFQDIQDYTEKPCLENKNTRKLGGKNQKNLTKSGMNWKVHL